MGLGGIVKGLLGGNSGARVSSPISQGQTKKAYTQANNAVGQQQQFLNAIQAQNGLQNQSDVYNQLQQMAMGQGPNPAQAMLQNATGQNVANQAALMASARGAAANPALIARQAAMAGGQAQQDSAGQMAALQAQQSANAIGQAGNMANTMAGNQGTAVGNLNQFSQGLLGQGVGAQNAANAQNAQLQQQQNGFGASLVSGLAGGFGSALAGPLAGGLGGLFGGGGGVASGASAPAGMMVAAKGGPVEPNVKAGPKSRVGMYFAKGGKVPALVSPGERYLPPQAVAQVKQGEHPANVGEKIPGKAKVKGAKDSYKNDTVRKDLESGGIVVPRSITQSKNPEKAIAEFVAAVLKRKG